MKKIVCALLLVFLLPHLNMLGSGGACYDNGYADCTLDSLTCETKCDLAFVRAVDLGLPLLGSATIRDMCRGDCETDYLFCVMDVGYSCQGI